MSEEIEISQQAILDSQEAIEQQRALRGEFITAKTKAQRTARAGEILEGVHYHRCPQCGTDISERSVQEDLCNLCGSIQTEEEQLTATELEIIRHDLNDRIDQIADSIARREYEVKIMERQLRQTTRQKVLLDQQLQVELARYDSSFIESIRAIEREIATLIERLNSLNRLQQMPQAVDALEEEAGALQGRIDRIRSLILGERGRLQNADANISAIAEEFKRIMLAISYPGVSEEDVVSLDPRNWRASVTHDDQEWSFWDTGSGGKKTLFNVCYALAVHKVGNERGMPIPNLLIIDSPTKNISEDENPELVHSLYSEIYKLALDQEHSKIQFLLIDSNFVSPEIEMAGFSERRMAGVPDAPSLISYYDGP
ncbi:MAG: hypothetical protein EOP04_27400 [Proteobacteria bacterium]|nr:MAG: hypothetical protein EOP04_27400 [Pseudomonadota bacterium]